jgi:hypothetical protein
MGVLALEALMRRIQDLSSRKKRISEEINTLTTASGADLGEASVGCLRLEDVYCVKEGKRYGPFGPYYYIYFHRTGKLEKRYVGKRADQLNVRLEALGRLRELEAEYRDILKLERRMMRALRLS